MTVCKQYDCSCTAEINTRAVRALTYIHTYRQTDSCNPLVHAQRVNKGSGKHFGIYHIGLEVVSLKSLTYTTTELSHKFEEKLYR